MTRGYAGWRPCDRGLRLRHLDDIGGIGGRRRRSRFVTGTHPARGDQSHGRAAEHAGGCPGDQPPAAETRPRASARTTGRRIDNALHLLAEPAKLMTSPRGLCHTQSRKEHAGAGQRAPAGPIIGLRQRVSLVATQRKLEGASQTTTIAGLLGWSRAPVDSPTELRVHRSLLVRFLAAAHEAVGLSARVRNDEEGDEMPASGARSASGETVAEAKHVPALTSKQFLAPVALNAATVVAAAKAPDVMSRLSSEGGQAAGCGERARRSATGRAERLSRPAPARGC